MSGTAAFSAEKDSLAISQLEQSRQETTREEITLHSFGTLEKPGDRIGNYKLLKELGEGGCGLVFLAEQEAPLRRFVALKVIKAGMDTKDVLARFEAERQALALMDHPNIAKVLEAGTTSTGRPFFAMELVSTNKITAYCDQTCSTLNERLGLFVQVCQAADHAHRRGIIHRDIKPSNVLVTLNDGQPVVKIIDFGIAKAVAGQRLTEKTLFTTFEQFVGTPAYMSPEQVRFSPQEIDHRTDVYSLGVLLYELLTGETPLGRTGMRRYTLEEIRTIVCERAPVPPSKHLRRLGRGDLNRVAGLRRTQEATLVKMISRELDWIVMRALEKDVTRRYETAADLAKDVQRFLDKQPIAARPPSRVYRIRKVVERNSVALATCAALLLIIAVAVTISAFLMRTGKAARQAAMRSERERNDLTMQSRIRRLNDFALERTKAAKLGEAAGAYREILAIQKGLSGNNTADIASTLCQLALVTDLSNEPDEAARYLREAVDIQKQNSTSGIDAVTALDQLSAILQRQSKLQEAEAAALDALKIRTASLGRENPATVASLGLVGRIALQQGRIERAEAIFRDQLARATNANLDRHSSEALEWLVFALLEEKRFTEAEPMARKLTAETARVVGGVSGWAAFHARALLGRNLLGQERYSEAESLLLSGYEGMKSNLNEIPARIRCACLKEVVGNLCQLFATKGRPGDAKKFQRRLAAFEQAETICRHRSFSGEDLEKYIWPGREVIFLTSRPDLEKQTMTKLVESFDRVYEFYKKSTGREPEANPQLWHGRLTIAVGGNFAHLGRKGIELPPAWFDELYDGFETAEEVTHLLPYEMGWNFWFYGEQLDYNGADNQYAIQGGYALFMRFASMEAAQLKGGPFGGRSFAEFARRTQELVDAYEREPALTWRTTLLIGKAPANPMNLSCGDLVASFLLRLRRDYGGEEFVTRLWHEVGRRPKAMTPESAVDNFIVSASLAAKRDLTELFRERWRWPLSEEATREIRIALSKGNPP